MVVVRAKVRVLRRMLVLAILMVLLLSGRGVMLMVFGVRGSAERILDMR